MRTNRVVLCVLIVVVLAIAGSAWLIRSQSHPPRSAASTAGAVAVARKIIDGGQLNLFEKMAVQACRCSRNHRGKDWESACWGAFDKATAPFQPGEYATACMDNSDSGVCLGEKDGHPDYCISTNRTQFGSCSAEESRVADAIWIRAHHGARTPAEKERADKAALAETARAFAAFERGDKVQVPTVPAEWRESDGGGC